MVAKALINTAEARTKLSALKTASLITFQAIARGADRSASRCTFLFYVDLSRAYQTILTRMYKSLAHLHLRKQAIYQKYKYVYETSLRQDVMENPELMSEREKGLLSEMGDELDKITTAQNRMEMNVFVLRDLPGGPLSLR